MTTPKHKRIGLFGGSFDPIHCGHLLVAQAAMEELKLDRLFFIPAARSPFKPNAEPIATAQRLRLIRLALAGASNYEINLQEIERGGVSYSIDTVRDFTARFPGAEFHYLIGDDHVAKLPLWKNAEELSKLTRFAVIPRPGSEAINLPENFRGQRLTGWPLGVSSSDIRRRIKSGRTVDHLVPRTVAEALRNNRLYL